MTVSHARQNWLAWTPAASLGGGRASSTDAAPGPGTWHYLVVTDVGSRLPAVTGRARGSSRSAPRGGPWATIFLVGLLVWPCVALAAGKRSASVDLLLGTGVNFRTPLTIRQEGQPDIEFRARYDTRPLTSPFYYAVRFAFEGRRGAWELQLVHHKLHLSNPPDEIQHFEITHGFNVLTLNRAFVARGTMLRVGAGIVLAHTESTVRGLKSAGGGILDTGYCLTGPSLLIGVGKEFAVATDLYVGAEVQLIAAWARVPVADGTATAPNVALHFLLGAGYRF